MVRGYYLLEDCRQRLPVKAGCLRRFWFDRVGGIRLARIQTFNEQGLLITDVAYFDDKPFGETDKVFRPESTSRGRMITIV